MTQERDYLEYGLEHAGVIHYEVQMRMVTVEDNLAAIAEVGTESGMKITLAMLARAIVSLGAIPKEEITYQLLVQGLADIDYDTLVELQDRIKKKRQRAKPASSATDSSSSSSASTASGNPTSGQ